MGTPAESWGKTSESQCRILDGESRYIVWLGHQATRCSVYLVSFGQRTLDVRIQRSVRDSNVNSEIGASHGGDKMSWTDERVELLKRLWTEGLSASQIAGRLGGGVTRNAVIGKVHRLNLSGRAPQPRSSVPRPRRTREPSHPGRSTPSIHLPTTGATALKPSMRAEA